MRKGNRVIANIDWSLVLIYLALVLFGWLNIYSTTFNEAHPSPFAMSEEYGKQMMWMGVSFFLGIIILALEGRFIIRTSNLIYAITMLMLLLVLVFGKEVNGAKSWFGVGSFGIQPSEFAKIGVAMGLAHFLSRTDIEKVRMINIKIRGVPIFKMHAETIALLGIPSVLVLMQPDAGTFLVFTGFMLVLYREGFAGNLLLFGMLSVILAVLSLMMKDTSVTFFGIDNFKGQWVIMVTITILALLTFLVIRSLVRKRYRNNAIIFLIMAYIGSIGVIAGTDTMFKKLKSHQKNRIEVTLGLKEDPKKDGYNVHQAMSAIGSGDFFGKGYKQATMANKTYKHVPMHDTDFIFCSVGEELGFLGSTTVVLLFMALLIKIVFIAERQRSNYTKIFAYGVSCIFFMHFMINIGMAIGLAPVIGIPLPFFSYGGSSLMAFSILIFLLIRLDSERMDVLR